MPWNVPGSLDKVALTAGLYPVSSSLGEGPVIAERQDRGSPNTPLEACLVWRGAP